MYFLVVVSGIWSVTAFFESSNVTCELYLRSMKLNNIAKINEAYVFEEKLITFH